MLQVCRRCSHVRATGLCGACHLITEPFRRKGGDIVELHTCSMCGDPSETDERLCASCAVDFEMDLDEWLDEPLPQSD